MFEVLSDVPPPPKRFAGDDFRRYPFDTLGVGQSFVVPSEQGDLVRSAAKMWKRRHPGWDYTTRSRDGTTRVWRIA